MGLRRVKSYLCCSFPDEFKQTQFKEIDVKDLEQGADLKPVLGLKFPPRGGSGWKEQAQAWTELDVTLPKYIVMV